MDYLIEEVFREFQENLRRLLEKHDAEILLVHQRISGLEYKMRDEIKECSEKIGEVRVQTTNDKWKLFVAILLGAGGSQGVEQLISMFF